MNAQAGARLVAASFAVSIVGSTLFAWSYSVGRGPQFEGLGLGLAFIGLALALLWWTSALMPQDRVVEARPPKLTAPSARAEAAAEFGGGVGEVVQRRRWLARFGWTALAALGLGALFPLRSLGPTPQGRVGFTHWRDGLRLVREDGTPVMAADLDPGSYATAFPEGWVGTDHVADMSHDAVMVLRVNAGELKLPSGRKGWAPQGYIAYSKVCTHAGCSVALFRKGQGQLMCPCHQSTFDVMTGANVIFGPADRSLPQLPLRLAADGGLVAAGEMSGVIGPTRWEYPG